MPIGAEYDPNKSLEYLTRVSEHDPEDEEVRYLRAKLFLELGVPIKAKEDILKALFEKPHDIDFLFLKARIDKELGQMEEVLESIDRIQHLNQGVQRVDFLLFASEVYMELGNFNKASFLLSKATEYAPNYSRLSFQRARYYAYTSDTAKAFAFMKAAVAEDSVYDNAHIGMAELYLRQHHLDSSGFHLSKVKPTKDARYQTIMAHTLMKTGLPDSASKHWYNVLRQLPYSPEANYELAKYYMVKGDMGSAINFLKRIPLNDRASIKDYNYKFAVANEAVGNNEIALEYYNKQFVVDSTVLYQSRKRQVERPRPRPKPRIDSVSAPTP